MQKGYDLKLTHFHDYHGVHVVINFHKEGGVDRKEYQAHVDLDPD